MERTMPDGLPCKASVEAFSSLKEMAETVTRRARKAPAAGRHLYGLSGDGYERRPIDPSWSAGYGQTATAWSDLARFMRMMPKAGRTEYVRAMRMKPRLRPTEPEPVHDLVGSRPDIGAYLSGAEASMLRDPHPWESGYTGPGGTADIVLLVGSPAETEAEDLLSRGAAAVRAIGAFERGGIRTNVWAGVLTSPIDTGGRRHVKDGTETLVLAKVKDSSHVYAPGAILFAAGSALFSRVICANWMQSRPDTRPAAQGGFVPVAGVNIPSTGGRALEKEVRTLLPGLFGERLRVVDLSAAGRKGGTHGKEQPGPSPRRAD